MQTRISRCAILAVSASLGFAGTAFAQNQQGQVGQGQPGQGQVGQGQQQQGTQQPQQGVLQQVVQQGQYLVSVFEGFCIGGELCARDTMLRAQFAAPLNFGWIEVFAHDDIGDHANGLLDVYLDGLPVATNLDVKKAGSVHRIDLTGMQGSTIDLASATEDEIQIHWVKVFSY